jgi:hypothetical protein
MSERVKKLLTGAKSQLEVDETQDLNISLQSKYKHIDEDVISKIISTNEQFEKERQESGKYRFYGNIKSIVSNVLYNDNVKVYQRDEINSQGNTIKITNSKKTKSYEVIERDGWLGYIDNDVDTAQTYEKSNDKVNDNKSSLCEFIPFSPGYNRLKFDDPDGIPNYVIKITYPYKKEDINFIDTVSLTGDGINIISYTGVSINDVSYTTFKTVINHGVNVGDIVRLKNMNEDLDGEYQVISLGDDNGNNKGRNFVLDIRYVNSPSLINTKTTFKRVVSGVESEYYVRKFKRLSNGFRDYDSYPAAFAETYYGDEEIGFNFTKDIDISGLKDNLGRPLSELFLTIVKVDTDSNNDFKDTYWKTLTQNNNIPEDLRNRFWTKISAGFLTENDTSVKYNVRSISADTYEQTHFNGIDESDIEFVGDIVEYNVEELIERTLEYAHHRINTVYREYRKDIVNLSSTDGEYEVDDLREGYIYMPHNIIKIREFSSNITTTDTATITTTNGDVVLGNDDIPDYATLVATTDTNILTDNVNLEGDFEREEGVGFSPWTTIKTFKYRRLMDIGEYNTFGRGVDYPFKSDAHYIYTNLNFYLKRQDPPFNEYQNEVDITLPGDVDLFNFLVNSPNYVDFRVTSGNVGENDQIDGDTNSVTLTVILNEYEGNYDLGDRHILGVSVELPSITSKEIGDVC